MFKNINDGWRGFIISKRDSVKYYNKRKAKMIINKINSTKDLNNNN
jgi:hypothetical protein